MKFCVYWWKYNSILKWQKGLNFTLLCNFASLDPISCFMLSHHCAHGPVRFRHKNHLVGVRRRSCFGLKYPRWLPRTQLEVSQGVLKNSRVCATNAAGNCPKDSSKIPHGFTLTNVELRSLARQRLSSVTPPPSGPLHLKICKSGHKHVTFWYNVEKSIW